MCQPYLAAITTETYQDMMQIQLESYQIPWFW